jgi:two-component system, OmpR family, copper resistance phosphate regulon response regulator CusR
VNILVVEDDRRIANLLRMGLLEDGHQVELAHRGDEGRDLATDGDFDVVVLDVMLPGLDGYSILKHVRMTHGGVPILMLTAKDRMSDIVHGLDLGADDYVTKPFHLEVFLARVRAVGRRKHIPQVPRLTVGSLSLDRSTHRVYRGEEHIELTKKEYVILELLMRRANRIVTREQIVRAGWGYDADVRDNSIDFFLHSLRNKINKEGGFNAIRTVRSLGYLLEASE